MPYIPPMPKNRIFTAAVIALLVPLAAVWAQVPGTPGIPGSPAAPVAPPTDAEIYLDEAIKKVSALKSVSAKINQTVDMLDQKFSLTGTYLRAPNNRISLQLSVVGLADANGKMIQVCDGQTLWDYQQILDQQVYRKIEVAKVFEKLKSADLDQELVGNITTQLGFSGPQELLVGLRKALSFDQKESVTENGKDYVVLRGTWKSRDGLLGPNQPAISPTAQLPSYIPSMAVLTLGKDDGWPYKLKLVGKRPSVITDTRKIGQDGRPIGRRSAVVEVAPTVIMLTYSDVKLNPELTVEDFIFSAPPGARVDDTTQALLGMLDSTIQVRAAQKKAEAAKAEDPLLKESIPLPSPAPGGGSPTAPEPAKTPAPFGSVPR